MFWRLGIVTELFTGQDGMTRAAVIKTVNCDKISYLRRSIKHLILIELNAEIEETQEDDESTTTEPQTEQDSRGERLQRRAVAIRGELRRKHS